MRVLAIDTSTARGSVAIGSEQGSCGEVRMVSSRGHSAWVVPAVDWLLDRLGLQVQDLDGIGVILGPGSYTGVRVGLSTAQGLALAAEKTCVGLTSLETLAARIQGAGSSQLVPMVDAYRHEVFGAVFDADLRPVKPMAVGPVAEFLDGLDEDVAFVGDGAERFRAEIEETYPEARFPEPEPYLAATLARITCDRLRTGQGGAPEALGAVYLRDTDVRKKPA